jgi:hypothetical protein
MPSNRHPGRLAERMALVLLSADLAFRRMIGPTALLALVSLVDVGVNIAAWLSLLYAVALMFGAPPSLPEIAAGPAETIASWNIGWTGGIALIVILFLVGIGVRLVRGYVVATIRTRSFGLAISKIMEGVADSRRRLPGTGQAKIVSKLLQRDARYISKAVSNFAELPTAILIAVVILALGLVVMPVPFLIVAVAFLVALPFHGLVSVWGRRTMRRLLATAIDKRRVDETAVAELIASPFGQVRTGPPLHHKHPDVARFLGAYRDRMLLSTFSAAVSGIMLTAAVGGGLFYFRSLAASGAPPIIAVGLVVVVLRYLYGSISQVMQAISIVYSFGPLTHQALDLFLMPHASTPSALPDLPHRTLLFTREALTNRLSKQLVEGGGALVHGDWTMGPPDVVGRGRPEESPAAEVWDEAGFKASAESGHRAMADPGMLTVPQRLALSALYHAERNAGTVLISGPHLAACSPALRDAIIHLFGGDTRILIVYQSVAKRAPVRGPFIIATWTAQRLDVLGDLRDFDTLRDRIVAKLEPGPETDLAEAADVLVDEEL